MVAQSRCNYQWRWQCRVALCHSVPPWPARLRDSEREAFLAVAVPSSSPAAASSGHHQADSPSLHFKLPESPAANNGVAIVYSTSKVMGVEGIGMAWKESKRIARQDKVEEFCVCVCVCVCVFKCARGGEKAPTKRERRQQLTTPTPTFALGLCARPCRVPRPPRAALKQEAPRVPHR